VASDFNLSHFSENVIHDMQILGLVPTITQQTMDFLSDSWANMGQKEDFVNSDSNQQFQLVILKKKKKLKQHSETSNEFKVGASSRSPRWHYGLMLSSSSWLVFLFFFVFFSFFFFLFFYP